MGVVPLETLGLIVEALAYGDDQSSLAVVCAATDASAFSSVCKRIREACLAFGPAWANIHLFLSNWRPRKRPPSIEEFRERLGRSKNYPLRICFNLNIGLGLGEENIGDQIWSELLRCRWRWSVLHLEGPVECQNSVVCAKAVALSVSLHNPGPNLKEFSLTTPHWDGEHRCKSSHVDKIVVDGAAMHRITSSVPFTVLHHVDVPLSSSKLAYLDIGSQLGTTAFDVLHQTPNLETLVWHMNEVPIHVQSVALPFLSQLLIRSLRVPPPVVAENLIEMVIEDSHHPLDVATFDNLTGGYQVVTTLKYLHLVSNPGIANDALMTIWNKCPSLRRFSFPSSPGSYSRTEMYRAVGNKIARDYVLNSRVRLKSVQCHGAPTRQPGLNLYNFVARMGGPSPEPGINLHWDIWRVLCGPCRGRFDTTNKEFFEDFKAQNCFDSHLIMAGMYDKYINASETVPNPFTVVLVFASLEAATKCLENGVIFRSERCGWVKKLEGRSSVVLHR
ncbi:hypothetical protein DFH06DRAFT_1130469 [Mycena polygramma]|nr:hypothetical protein DFH06DRAFT_1130469 [Mycena polygramma]